MIELEVARASPWITQEVVARFVPPALSRDRELGAGVFLSTEKGDFYFRETTEQEGEYNRDPA